MADKLAKEILLNGELISFGGSGKGIKQGTRSEIDAMILSGEIQEGDTYIVTDEDGIYQPYKKDSISIIDYTSQSIEQVIANIFDICDDDKSTLFYVLWSGHNYYGGIVTKIDLRNGFAFFTNFSEAQIFKARIINEVVVLQ